MVVTGGIWAAFQKNLGRLFGYIVIVESGFSLLAISLGNPTGYQILVTMLLPRLIAMALWSLSLSVLVKGRGMDIGSLRGILYGKPVASIGILVALFSMGSFPILGGFPTRLFLLENLAAKSLSISLWVGVGILGLLISGLRLLSIAVHAQGPFMHDQESWQQSLLIIGGIFLLLLIGIFPHNFSIAMMELLNAFGRLF
jgi:NADH-quinone oxidoreductase subunit N